MLREAARDLVPDFVLSKRKRGFFNESVGDWIGADGGGAVQQLLLSRDPAYARSSTRRPCAGRSASGAPGSGNPKLLLALVMLELWLGEYLPRALAPADERIAA